ncbi:Fatty acid desaturase [Planctomycetes bacterium Pla163]|uniref:Fatty acid desaturase n=1 Tax=Rohdeia mirabilis TaxID=2528008 RepID=A0A518CXI4_9BACT|nr:Fatty acid desaturase [Planctomycetes bacterium Pla163]
MDASNTALRPSDGPAGQAPDAKRPIDWVNLTTIAVVHLLGAAGIWWVAAVQFSWATVGLAIFWYLMCGFAITGGYHRLFAHKAYKANWLLTAIHLFFGAASVQNTALKWSADHRVHHAHSDTDKDPYSVTKGFWWAHIGWVLRGGREVDLGLVKDLEKNALVRFQHRHYILLAVLSGAVVPMLIGLAWGDPIGALLFAGFTRLVLQWHATFSVNSFAHLIGSRPYDPESTARDSWIVALMTFGEGYHNYHHKFPSDYRNGVRWWQFDPTKWVVWSFSKVGITSDLRRAVNAEKYKLATALKKAQEAAAAAAANASATASAASAAASEAASNAARAAKAATSAPAPGPSL